jgi:hypothetical protein
MTKLNREQENILRLILRSKAGNGGWYRVSPVVWPLVDGALPADLAKTKAAEGGGYIRLTERGQAVADYL